MLGRADPGEDRARGALERTTRLPALLSAGDRTRARAMTTVAPDDDARAHEPAGRLVPLRGGGRRQPHEHPLVHRARRAAPAVRGAAEPGGEQAAAAAPLPPGHPHGAAAHRPARVGRRRELRPPVPRPPDRAPGPRRRHGARAADLAPDGAAVRPRAAAVGAVVGRGPHRGALGAAQQAPPRDGRRRVGRRHGLDPARQGAQAQAPTGRPLGARPGALEPRDLRRHRPRDRRRARSSSPAPPRPR